jgi:hypothetical protein
MVYTDAEAGREKRCGYSGKEETERYPDGIKHN